MGRDQTQIRIKSEVGTVKHVEALQFFFFLSIVFLNVKNLAFTPYSLCVCVCVCVRVRVSVVVVVGGGGGSRRYGHSKIYQDPAIGYSVASVDRPRYWRVRQWLQMHFTLTARAGVCVRSITMEMCTDVK